MYDLKGKLKRCNICGEDVMGEELLKEHLNKHHEDEKSNTDCRPSLDWICVLPGLDHLRMNTAKLVITTYWAYFIDVFRELGYESLSAQNLAQSCSNLHKTDQVLGK